jgi:hypothetical protein
MFQPSSQCAACHNGLKTNNGEDVSIDLDWRATIMANASRDPYWHAGVRRETLDHPTAQADIENECSICHMPMAHYESTASGAKAQVFAHLGFNPANAMDALAEDGVSCSVCHQISADKLGTKESFVGRFVIAPPANGGRTAYGPFAVDAGRTRIMRSAAGFQPTQAAHIRESELCATCHTLYTRALNPRGEVIGELPEQVPYEEWLQSDFKGNRSCQSCHMPRVDGAPISSVLPQVRDGAARHLFLGGNFFMLRILNEFRDELSVKALPNELSASAMRTVEHLQTEAATVRIESVETGGGRLSAQIHVENLTGHKLPTAYPSRRAWLHVTIRDGASRVIFESGALRQDGSIAGNDNDADAGRFEPHYAEISDPGQVQIYEDIMSDPAGKPTTGLLTALTYLKDNRLLPRGFEKGTAPANVAVHGEAAQDADFSGGGDTVRYSVPLGGAQGPFQVEAELLYQPIGYRWAHNLDGYNAPEPQRFVRYYRQMSGSSAVPLAHASAVR